MPVSSCDIAVIGGGIIGVSCALALSDLGQSVILIEPQDFACGASKGNAGALAFAEILPLASPRIIRKATRWLFDPLGPLSLPPAYLPRIAPWLLHLWRASWKGHYQANIQAQVALMGLARTEMQALLEQHGLTGHLRAQGVLEVYEGEARYQASLDTARQRALHGIDSQLLQGAELAAAQPGLAPRFTHGVYIADWRNVADPQALGQAIGQQALAHGVRHLRQTVRWLRPTTPGVQLILDDGAQLQARQVVLAAGARSHVLAAQLGDRIPLETERGYNTTLPADALDLRQQITFSDHGFVISPLTCGIRVGGAVELAGLNRAPDYRRAQVMLDKAKVFMPGLRTTGGTQWMGFRPSLPDSLPIIGRSAHHPDVLYAFGHGHLGLTQSAATARLIRDLVGNQPPAIDLRPYRAQRFSFLGSRS
ncbi:NAD(P)/FAD-dependent oxidoreductase [Castellaniella caeni]|uniref:NAD(P)/FAD-dependent oxidoreductase n=1 Tax=Castellaniella caeni TaxID=266123 RepID=UPI000C9F0DB1|nr:FAD-dependent oxidoreductase [Castellaniella caeni]